MQPGSKTMERQMQPSMGMYGKFAAMIGLSFVSMYILMYAMVDSIDSVYPNINQLYMAGLMTAPMVILEMLLMGAMYENKAANIGIVAVAAIALVAFFAFIRVQAAVGDRQFLKSMIPHHSGAILMCRQAKITDPEIKKLCSEILDSQEREINQMKAILTR